MQGTSTGRTNAGDAMYVCIHGHMGIFLSFCSLMRTPDRHCAGHVDTTDPQRYPRDLVLFDLLFHRYFFAHGLMFTLTQRESHTHTETV